MQGAASFTSILAFAGTLLASLQLSNSALAQSGYQTINGTQVYTVIDQGRGVATFSNSCGTQSLTQRQLQAGAIPDDIIPCPRPGRAAAPSPREAPVSRQFAEYECRSAKEDLESAEGKDDRQAAIEKAVREIRRKCPSVGMNDIVDRANKRMAQLREEIKQKEKTQAGLREVRQSADPKRAFDASLLATRADRLYHEGNYREAATLLLSAIETYKSIGQPIAARELEKQLGRFTCKSAIDIARDKDGTPEAPVLWRKAKDACSKFPDDQAFALRSLKRELELAVTSPTVNPPKTPAAGVAPPKVTAPSVAVPTVHATKPNAGQATPPTVKAPTVREQTVAAPTVNTPEPRVGRATPPTVKAPTVRMPSAKVSPVEVPGPPNASP